MGRPLLIRAGLVVVAATSILLATAASATAYVPKDDTSRSLGNASAVLRSTEWTRRRPSNTALPTISGQAQVLQTLTAAPGTWSGVLPMSFSYRWKRCDAGGSNCSKISGATDSSYPIVAADVGRTLRVTVTASNWAGSQSATSAPTSPVGSAPPVPPSNTAAPAISGQAQLQQTLTATPGTWSGTNPMSFGYQWSRCDLGGANCSTITGAGSSSYQVAVDDLGATLEVSVTASNAAGSASASSAPTSPVGAAPLVAPSNTAAPAISGQAQLQQTLTATSGTWSGTQPMSFAYQWSRCDAGGANCSSIAGATNTSYAVSAADGGSTLKVSVTASNSAGSASASSAATSPVAGASSSTVTPKQMYWGAWIGSQLSGTEAPWDMNAVSDFETMTGKAVSIVNWSSSFTNCGNPCHFQTAQYEAVRQHGAIPFFSWGSTGFTDAQIVSGVEDSYITMWATEAKAWGHPFFLRFNWEMNGNWFDWAVGKNGNTAASYVAAWRHVHDIFASVGALNVTWVWCPNIDPSNIWAPLSSVYPGDAYVDWTCLDGYNWDTPWMSFDQLYGSTYNKLVTLAPSKPVAIGEISSTEAGGSKASWITDLLTTQLTTRYPQVKALVWFEKFDSGMDWPIESSSTSKAAFAAGIASSAYASNQFASLGSGPIQPLS